MGLDWGSIFSSALGGATQGAVSSGFQNYGGTEGFGPYANGDVYGAGLDSSWTSTSGGGWGDWLGDNYEWLIPAIQTGVATVGSIYQGEREQDRFEANEELTREKWEHEKAMQEAALANSLKASQAAAGARIAAANIAAGAQKDATLKRALADAAKNYSDAGKQRLAAALVAAQGRPDLIHRANEARIQAANNTATQARMSGNAMGDVLARIALARAGGR